MSDARFPGTGTPAAGFDEPFELLAACHDRVRQRLDLLQRLVHHVQANGADRAAHDAASDVLRYFDIAAPHHHEDEERHLVPLLAASDDPALREAAQQLLAGHVELRAAWNALRPLLLQLGDPTQGAALAEVARHFIALHGPHMALEDSLVYPAAAKRTGPHGQAAMGREMAARRGALIPPNDTRQDARTHEGARAHSPQETPMFNALMLTQDAQRHTHAALTAVDEAALRAADPDGQVLVRISHSALNYKDALAITGQGAIARKWPMVAGIDLAGTVEHSEAAGWQPGDEVVLTGLGLSETHWGGLAQKAWLPASWLFRRPAAFDARSAMGVATAGVTAALCVLKLQEHGLRPGDGEVLVTGAAGGVGSIALALLASLGYRAIASTGRPQERAYLARLGAADIVERSTLSGAGKPLQSERWAGVVDSVGSHTLANACAQTRIHGAVAACGLAQGPDLPCTVMPFILRGVTLYGINSVYLDDQRRGAAWDLLDRHLDRTLLDTLCVEIGLTEAIGYAPRLIAGEVRGRTIVDVNR